MFIYWNVKVTVNPYSDILYAVLVTNNYRIFIKNKCFSKNKFGIKKWHQWIKDKWKELASSSDRQYVEKWSIGLANVVIIFISWNYSYPQFSVLEERPFGVHNVRLVLGGGPFTIDFILAELKKKNPVPVIAITGSGKAADILAYAHRSVTWY